MTAAAPPAPATGAPDLLTWQKAIVVAHRTGQRLYALRLAGVVTAATIGVAGGLAGGVESTGSWAEVGGLAAALVPLALSWLVGLVESRATGHAATLQHHYDTVAFGLPESPFVDGTDPAAIEARARRWSGSAADEHNLRHWYLDTSGLPRWAGVMCNQRLNLRWDIAQRRRIAWFALAAALAGLAAGAGVARIAAWGVAGWLIGWVGPTAGVTQLAVETWFRHRGLAADKAALDDRATRLLHGTDPSRPGRDDCAALQLELLALRRRAPRVPVWLQRRSHRRLRAAAERDLTALRRHVGP